MLTTRLIPCLDIKGGRVVKGVRFQGLRDAGDPVEQARRYEADGADELVILDVSATLEERGAALDVIRQVRQVLSVPLTAGGGVRQVRDAQRLLEAGADKVAVNSAAVAQPGLLRELAEAFGRQCVVIAVDAARRGDSWRVLTHGGSRVTEIDAIGWLAEAERLGAGEALLTSWDRDGTGLGYDEALLSAARRVLGIPLIASGGARDAAHLVGALRAGADAVLAATIFHDGLATCGSIKSELQHQGVRIRS